mmetsp:Transcript_14138/g.20190  ORF Transcript_14138/g.20190 Transcript_14138/m.20190 type:complete len:324 (+) Transcript_14138:24-995(+)
MDNIANIFFNIRHGFIASRDDLMPLLILLICLTILYADRIKVPNPSITAPSGPALEYIDGDKSLMVMRSSQKLGGLIEIGGFGLIAKTQKNSQSKAILSVINPLHLSQELLKEIKKIESDDCKVGLIYTASSIHTLHLADWAKNFPEARIYAASDRIQKVLPDLNMIIVDEQNPCVPELSSDFDLKPILEFVNKPVISLVSHDSPLWTKRSEQVVYHKISKTLFVLDHVFAPKKFNTDMDISWNHEGFTPKFKMNKKLARQCLLNILSLNFIRIIFGHGSDETYCVDDSGLITGTKESATAKERLKLAYAPILNKLNSPKGWM